MVPLRTHAVRLQKYLDWKIPYLLQGNPVFFSPRAISAESIADIQETLEVTSDRLLAYAV